MIIGSLLVLLLYICELISVVSAAEAVLPPQEKPPEYASIPGCYLKEKNKMLSFNESFSPEDGKSCVRYTCGFDGYTDIFGCSAQSFEGNCVKVPGNRSLPYPECCDGVDCSQGKETNTSKDIYTPNTNKEPKIENLDIPKNSQTEDVNLEEGSNPKQEETGNNRSSKLLQIDEQTLAWTNTKTEESQEANSETSQIKDGISSKSKIVEQNTEELSPTSPVNLSSDFQSTDNSEMKPEAPISETSNSSEGLPAVKLTNSDSHIPSENPKIKNIDPRVNNPSPEIHENLTLKPKLAPEVSFSRPEITENLKTKAPQTPNDVSPDVKEEPSAIDKPSAVTDVKPSETDEVLHQSQKENPGLEDPKEKPADVIPTDAIKKPSEQDGSSGSKDVENLGNAAETKETTAT